MSSINTLLISQDYKCAICETDRPGGGRKHFCVDHCHKTNKIRGLLCVKCNIGQGYFNDDPSLTQALTDYLIKYNQQMAKDPSP